MQEGDPSARRDAKHAADNIGHADVRAEHGIVAPMRWLNDRHIGGRRIGETGVRSGRIHQHLMRVVARGQNLEGLLVTASDMARGGNQDELLNAAFVAFAESGSDLLGGVLRLQVDVRNCVQYRLDLVGIETVVHRQLVRVLNGVPQRIR